MEGNSLANLKGCISFLILALLNVFNNSNCSFVRKLLLASKSIPGINSSFNISIIALNNGFSEIFFLNLQILYLHRGRGGF